MVSKITSYNNRCETEFIELERIGCGSFGGVFKVQSTIDSQIYAMKKIPYNSEDDSLLKEVNILTNLNSEFVVKFHDSWSELNYYQNIDLLTEGSTSSRIHAKLSDPNKSHILHIQMEYCPLTLHDVINAIDTRNNFGYFIMSELLTELIDCVNYLHTLQPPVIHRDLKPRNILISYGCNGKYLKLTDFGLSTLHEFDEQSHTSQAGSVEYIAPEVVMSRDYNIKADIYSLGVCIQKIFKININRADDSLKYKNILKMILDMVKYTANDRPSCDQILDYKKLWIMSVDEVKELIGDKTIQNTISDIKKSLNLSQDDCLLESFLSSKSTQVNCTTNIERISDECDSNELELICSNNTSKKQLLVRILKNNSYEKNFPNIARKFYSTSYAETGTREFELFKNVYKAKCLKEKNRVYGIRKIGVNLEQIGNCAKEIVLLSKLDRNYISPCDNWWFEENYYVKQQHQDKNLNYGSFYISNFSHFLHIKMPLYSLTLRNIIEQIKVNYFDKLSNLLTPCGYFVASQIFKEIVCAVNYLHQQNPPIFHRNLKPENIMLLLYCDSNNNFVRLSDFGITTIDFQSYQKYSNCSAPEVNNFKQFSAQSDSYSLGAIAHQLFSINFRRNYQFQEEVHHIKSNHLIEMVKTLMSLNVEERQNCQSILNTCCLWLSYYEDVCDDITIKAIISGPVTFLSKEHFFICTYIREKLKTKDKTSSLLKWYPKDLPIDNNCVSYNIDNESDKNHLPNRNESNAIKQHKFPPIMKIFRSLLKCYPKYEKTVSSYSYDDEFDAKHLPIRYDPRNYDDEGTADDEDLSPYDPHPINPHTYPPIVKILLTYSQIDGLEYAKSLKTWLNYNKCRVFLDVDAIYLGIDWYDELNIALFQCDAVVALVTPTFGVTNWAKTQLDIAHKLQKQIILIDFLNKWPPETISFNSYTAHYIRWKTYDEISKQDKNGDNVRIDDNLKHWDQSCVQRTAKEIADKIIASYQIKHD